MKQSKRRKLVAQNDKIYEEEWRNQNIKDILPSESFQYDETGSLTFML